MKRMVMALMLLCAGRAHSTTADGTLITNVATATFGSVMSLTFPSGDPGYAVSYASTVTVLVATPVIALQKTAAPSIECSGGTVTFCILTVNTSALTSAFNVYTIDKLPDQLAYVAGGQTSWTTTTGSGVLGSFVRSALPTLNGAWPSEPINGAVGGNAGGDYYLRWVVDMIGPGKSAMVCYKAQIL